MKQALIICALLLSSIWLMAQQTATLKISNIHYDLNGEEHELPGVKEFALTDHEPAALVLFEDESGFKFGCVFQYKKGRNRIKLTRKCFADKPGMDRKTGKFEKDMQELKTSITGSFTKRVISNIILSRDNLESIYVSFNYELIYK